MNLMLGRAFFFATTTLKNDDAKAFGKVCLKSAYLNKSYSSSLLSHKL